MPELDATDAMRRFHRETDNWPAETPAAVSRDLRRGLYRLDFTGQPPDNLPLTFKEFGGITYAATGATIPSAARSCFPMLIAIAAATRQRMPPLTKANV